MDQMWMQILMAVVFCQKITSGVCRVMTVKENQPVEIQCTVSGPGSTIVWFRILDTLSVEFIASFDINGKLKKPANLPTSYNLPANKKNHIALTSFNKARDSGAYSCASQRGTEMVFGHVTRLIGEKVEVRTEAPPETTKPLPCTTTGPCVCDSQTDKDETSPLLLCSPMIMGPLVGGCGLLLLLLIVTTVYCNKIRTRRCPHHYKRKPRAMPPGKQMMTNRPM